MMKVLSYVLVAVLAAGSGLAIGLVVTPQDEYECPPPPVCVASPAAAVAEAEGLPPEPSDDTPARRPNRIDPAPAKSQEAIDQLSAKAAIQEKLIEGMRVEKLGEPIPWRAGIPSTYHRDQFEHTVSKGLDEIESPLEPIQFECSEPPCIAVLRGNSTGQDRPKVWISQRLHDLAISQAWREAYGDEFSLARFHSVDCGDGTTEWVMLMAAAIEALESDQDAANLKRRIDARTQQVISGASCRKAGQ